MTLDLLHEFSNTEVFCLFHNCMWPSRHSEVNVYFLALCEQTDGLFTFTGSHRSYLICVFVFVCVFVLILTFNRHWHTTLHKSPRAHVGAFAAKQDTFVDFLSGRNGWLLPLNRSLRSYNWVFGFWLGLLGVFTSSSNFLNPILSSKCLYKKSSEEVVVTHILSRKWLSPVPIMIAFGIR